MDPKILASIDFGEQSEARWRALASKALKGEAIETALFSYTDDGLEISPLCPRTDGAKPVFARAHEGWTVIARVDDPNIERAARQAKDDVNGGATGLSFVFEGSAAAYGYGLPASLASIAAVLDDISLEGLTLRIEAHPHARMSADWLADYLRARKANMGKMKLSLGIDQASVLASTGRLKMTLEALEASLPQSLAGYFAAGIPGVLLEADGRPYHDAGATEAQELGAMLSVATSHLRMFEKARQPIGHAAQHIGFALAVDQDQFVSIAKLRALRALWARVLEVSGIDRNVTAHIHAQTSWRMLTHKDAETNILRSTIAVFAATVGGADSISVLPHTLAHGLPNSEARRIARNTQLVLKDEASIGFVDDPSAGSGSIERLTQDLCAAAWAQFQLLESEGGLLHSLAASHFQKRVRDAAEVRHRQFAAKARTIVGTTIYAQQDERSVECLTATKPVVKLEAAMHCEALRPSRIAEPFEGANA